MLSGGGMTEQVMIYRKGIAGTSPEAWVSDGLWRRADVARVSDRAALEESAAYELTVTHQAYVDYRADVYEAVGHGVRVLKRKSDGQNFWIVRATGVGRRGRLGKQRYMRLALDAFSPAVV